MRTSLFALDFIRQVIVWKSPALFKAGDFVLWRERVIAREGQSLLRRYSLPVDEIEEESFRLIRKLLGHLAIPDRELQVVVRIVHACGDPQVAPHVLFHPLAMDAALDAFRRGASVFTDVRMAAAGIKSGLGASFGCTVRCALDVIAGDSKPASGQTRTAWAMESLGCRLDGAIVVIGNAPTALLAVLDMAEEGKASPAVIIGMPVGFVAAAEAKEELARRDIPFITVKGTRGGSGIAAAAVNALMLLVAEKSTAPEEVKRDRT